MKQHVVQNGGGAKAADEKGMTKKKHKALK